MKRIELEIQHSYKEKFMGRHRIKHTSGLTTLGSSREATLRLLGDHVSPFHAHIEFLNNNWVISDLCSESGTWLQSNKIVERKIHKLTTIHIGEHVLKLAPKIVESTLFSKENVNKKKLFTNCRRHQIVVRKLDYVIETILLPESSSYHFLYDKKDNILAPPEGGKWLSCTFGDTEIQQRIIDCHELDYSPSEKVKNFVDPSLKKPLLGALALMLIFTSIMILSPNNSEEVADENKPKVNKYTKIIFDAKSVKKFKAQAKKSQSKIANRQPAARSISSKSTTITKLSKQKTVVKVVNKLKASGLSKLIGKIAKRASKTAHLIRATGRVAGSGPSGRALSRMGRASVGASSSKLGKSFKVAGVSTGGKGGGATNFRGTASLSTGGIGTADVGIIEEETVIEGGLPREVIARVIATYLGQIRYCYERQLAAHPGLYGKVLVRFTIAGNGRVSAQGIGSSTMNSRMVEGCMLRKVAKWKFPKPKGGTEVSVSYPFLFKSTL